MNRTNPFFFAVMGFGAWVLSETIYRYAIVSRLPEWRSVPIWCWAVQLLPLVIAALFTGIVSQTLRRAAINGFFLFSLPLGLIAVYGLVTGRAVAHDLWASSLAYWLVASAQLALGILIVVLTAAIAGAATRRRHGV
jgi:hypothetical protein